MKARYPSTCGICKSSISAGEEIKRSGNGDWVHAHHGSMDNIVHSALKPRPTKGRDTKRCGNCGGPQDAVPYTMRVNGKPKKVCRTCFVNRML